MHGMHGMYWHHGWFFGMRILWWLFWIFIAVGIWRLVSRWPATLVQRPSESPLDIVKRRYAEGALTTAEYEERLAKLSESKQA
jgi:putative membrane protein